jgi:hypothetical protein
MYSHYPNLLLGFHGCNESVINDIIKKSRPLAPSNKNMLTDTVYGVRYF